MKQTEMNEDKQGKDLLQLQRYQVTVSAIEEWTGLEFGPLKDADELAWAPPQFRMAETGAVGPGFRPIRGPEDIVFSGSHRRAAGGRIQPLGATEPRGAALQQPFLRPGPEEGLRH
jgi:hypothetical protein